MHTRSYFIAGIVIVSTLVAVACKSSDDEASNAPTCENIQKKIDACDAFSRLQKEELRTQCDTGTEACRVCLRDKLCDASLPCDTTCNPDPDGGDPLGGRADDASAD